MNPINEDLEGEDEENQTPLQKKSSTGAKIQFQSTNVTGTPLQRRKTAPPLNSSYTKNMNLRADSLKRPYVEERQKSDNAIDENFPHRVCVIGFQPEQVEDVIATLSQILQGVTFYTLYTKGTNYLGVALSKQSMVFSLLQYDQKPLPDGPCENILSIDQGDNRSYEFAVRQSLNEEVMKLDTMKGFYMKNGKVHKKQKWVCSYAIDFVLDLVDYFKTF